MEIAVVGLENFVIGFRLAGIRKTYIATDADIEEKIHKALDDRSVGILVIHNSTIKNVSHTLKRRIEESVQPVVVAIGKEGGADIQERIKQAIGIDLWKS